MSIPTNLLYIFNGYCNKISYNTNEIVHVYANGNRNFENVNIDIKNLNGDIVKTIFVKKLLKQTDNFYGLPNSEYWSGFNPTFKYKIVKKPWLDFCYDEFFSFDIKNFKSGIYLIGEKIKFIVKGNTNAPITYLYSSNTECAYNGIGGKSLYYDWQGKKNIEKDKALVVGFHRPVMFTPINDNGTEFGEVIDVHQRGILNWLEKQNYNINYICDLDMDEMNNINETKVLIIGGHSEYWTMKARNNLELIINNGTNILSLSGNTLWWCVDYVDNYTKMVCIREKDKLNLLETKYTEQKAMSQTIQFCRIKKNFAPFYILGVDYIIGGYGKIESNLMLPYYSIIYKNTHKILTGIKNNKLFLNYQEFDGIYTNIQDPIEVYTLEPSDIYKKTDITDIESVIDKIKLNEKVYSYFEKKKLIMIGTVEYPSSRGVIKRFSGIIAVKKNDITGTIINTCCMDWCHPVCFDSKESGEDIKTITKNCIDILLDSSNNIFV